MKRDVLERGVLERAGLNALKGLLTGLILWNVVAGSVVLAQRGRGREMDDSSQYGWHANYQEAKALAKKSGLPLMVVIRCVP